MSRRILLALGALALGCWSFASAIAQPQTEPRVALVIGNANYARGPLPNALNDAGLVAEALRTIGYDIVEGADLNQGDMLRAFRDFLAKVEAGGPDTLAIVYFSGHGVAFEGENFLMAADARLERESDLGLEAVRLMDLLRPLAEMRARAKVMIVDAARPSQFAPQGRGLSLGLTAIEAPPGMLVAFSSAPGTVAPDGQGPYGAYATAIAEMIRAPGFDLDSVFVQVRSRTHQITQGQQTPWHISALGEHIELVPPEAQSVASAPPPPPPPRARRPMREIGPEEAYALAIEMDELDGYVSFVETYPGHPLTERVWAIIRARREALSWYRALQINTPQSYWTYLRRYPNGIYAFDAERRLRRLGAGFAPPPDFAMMDFDGVPMALVDEPREYRPVHRVGPRPPLGLIALAPLFFRSLPPPPRRSGPRALPVLATPIPVVPRLAPAPRRTAPAAVTLVPASPIGPSSPRLAPRGPALGVAPSTAPGVAPRTAPGTAPGIAPGTAPGTTPGTPPRVRPGVRPPPPGFVGRPPVTPPSVRSGPGSAPSTAPRVAPAVRTAPPAVVSRPPPPAPAVRTAPPPARPTPPPPPRVASPPPPARSAPPPQARRPAPPPAAKPAPAAKPPACPAGKSWKDGACR